MAESKRLNLTVDTASCGLHRAFDKSIVLNSSYVSSHIPYTPHLQIKWHALCAFVRTRYLRISTRVDVLMHR